MSCFCRHCAFFYTYLLYAAFRLKTLQDDELSFCEALTQADSEPTQPESDPLFNEDDEDYVCK